MVLTESMGRPRTKGSPTDITYQARTEETLPEASKIFRDAFVREYIKDFNGPLALARIGVSNWATAKVRASQLLREPYVANKLQTTIRELQPMDVVTRQQVMAAMWKEANATFNMCATRVAALAHIAKMLGMMERSDTPDKQVPIGVMLVPCMTAEEWATAAPAAQAVLKANAGAGTVTGRN